jgi:hypothetical protein
VHADRFGPTVHEALGTAGPGTRLALPPRTYLARYGHVIAVGADHDRVTADLARAERLVELASVPLTS